MPSLSDVMAKHANPVEMLRNSTIGMYVYPVVTPEFRNWRVEQEAWRNSAVLFDQSHHMDELIVEGPQAEEFLAYHGINAFGNFNLNRAKHYVPVTPNGHVIGDHIIFREREDKFILVGRAPTSNWLMFCAAYGNWSVRIKHDPRSTSRPEGERVLRTHYRYQIQGPDAPKIFEKMNGGPIPDIKFFHVDRINVGSKKVQALRHGMSGAPGLEIWGPYDDKHYIHSTILEAARDAGVDLVQCGSRAYSTNTLESGWIPSPLPGIYTGDGMLAAFNAGRALERPSAAAVAVAANLQVEAARSGFKARVGVASGPLAAGAVGSAARRAFTVYGDTVNRASRLEAFGKDCGEAILLDAATAAHAPAARSLGLVRLRGLAEEIEVYSLLANISAISTAKQNVAAARGRARGDGI